MKSLIFSLVLILLTLNLASQEENKRNFSIGFHFNPNVLFRVDPSKSYEGSPAFEEFPSMGYTYGLSFSAGQESELKKFNFKNSAQVEVGGHGLFYSFNYERVIFNGSSFKTTAQAGISYYPKKTGVRDLWMPLVINEILSFTKHHIELGAGYVVIREAFRDLENNPISWFWSGVLTGRLGYRYQIPDGRINIRVGFTPFLEYDYNYEFHPSGGLAIGYCF